MNDYNSDGYYIMSQKKWAYYRDNPKEYRKKKRRAWLCMLIPFLGIIMMDSIFDEMGLSIF